jgi:hypothetical protein
MAIINFKRKQKTNAGVDEGEMPCTLLVGM